ncbi:ABC transporter permease [Metabacillus sp. GX 13764]|uniref:ABC transporter permease n=1 Tax=Metabacillus kandeliae TaxID=2900151 RepID=UPI001E2E558F|nr:ABC transporter permease [Metabacillus kandeliae]MCD7035360.1 ABC transporter permease [Metabacillus kandeliae]
MFLSLRELKHAKLRYLLIGSIMILIAFLVLFVSGLAKGLSSDNASSIQLMKADYFLLQKEADHRLNRSSISHEIVHQVQHTLAEDQAAPLAIRMGAITKEKSDKKIDASFFAIDPDSMLKPNLAEGQMPAGSSDKNVAADESLKEEGFSLGDQIRDSESGKTFTITGFTKAQSFSHTPVIHLTFKEWKAINKADPAFNAIALKTSAGMEKNLSGFEVVSKSEALQGIPGYKEEQGSLLMMIVFLFIIAGFVLAVFFYVVTIQKINQFGVLKAIGASSGYLAKSIIGQILLLTVLSLAAAALLAYGLAALLPGSMPFDLAPSLVILCSALFLAVSLIGSLLSLYKVVKIDAIDAIGRAA